MQLLLLKTQSAGRTGSHAFTTIQAPRFSHWLITKGSNPPIKATVGKTKGANTQALPADPDTPPTEHALVRVIDKRRAARIHRQVT